MPRWKYKERKRGCVPCQAFVHLETSHISTDDHFAALQIDKRLEVENLSVFGRASNQFPNYEIIQ